jgi:hypothetical protein
MTKIFQKWWESPDSPYYGLTGKQLAEAVWGEQQKRIDKLEAKLRIAELKNKGTLANNLCPDCRDKQVGKPCLACTIQSLEAKLAAAPQLIELLREMVFLADEYSDSFDVGDEMNQNDLASIVKAKAFLEQLK